MIDQLSRRRFVQCLAASLSACSAGRNIRASESLSSDENDLELVKANNALAFVLLKRLVETQPSDNQFFSPLSLESAFLIAMLGAKGQTAVEMGRVFQLPKQLQLASGEPNLAKLSNNYQALINRLPIRSKLMTNGPRKPESDAFQLSTANSLWVDKSYPLSREFARIADQSFGTSSANSCDFQKSANAERVRINDWVAAQTHDKIRDIIPKGSLSPETRLVIANAIYFKGTWAKPFEASRTATAQFTDENQKNTPVSMMHAPALKEARYAAFHGAGTAFETPAMADEKLGQDKLYPGNDGYQVLEVPYAGDQLSMVVVLPRTPDGLNKLVASMTADQFASIRQQLKSRPVHVKLPKFKLESNYDLIPDLKALGMQAAFSPAAADFSGLTDSRSEEDRLYISLVIHKAYVDVNEQGTEAAASTIVGMARAAAPALSPFIPEFTANRPFLFSIIDRQTNNILFLGKVNSCPSSQ